jgi:hypothetical protein
MVSRRTTNWKALGPEAWVCDFPVKGFWIGNNGTIRDFFMAVVHESFLRLATDTTLSEARIDNADLASELAGMGLADCMPALITVVTPIGDSGCPGWEITCEAGVIRSDGLVMLRKASQDGP